MILCSYLSAETLALLGAATLSRDRRAGERQYTAQTTLATQQRPHPVPEGGEQDDRIMPPQSVRCE